MLSSTGEVLSSIAVGVPNEHGWPVRRSAMSASVTTAVVSHDPALLARLQKRAYCGTVANSRWRAYAPMLSLLLTMIS